MSERLNWTQCPYRPISCGHSSSIHTIHSTSNVRREEGYEICGTTAYYPYYSKLLGPSFLAHASSHEPFVPRSCSSLDRRSVVAVGRVKTAKSQSTRHVCHDHQPTNLVNVQSREDGEIAEYTAYVAVTNSPGRCLYTRERAKCSRSSLVRPLVIRLSRDSDNTDYTALYSLLLGRYFSLCIMHATTLKRASHDTVQYSTV